MLKAVVFDLDETLIDWSGFHGDWAEMETYHLGGVFDLLRQTHPLDDLQEYVAEVRARSMAAWTASRADLRAPNLVDVLVESALALGVPRELIRIEDCLQAYRWGAVKGTVIFPGVVETLTLLRDNGIKTGIITNAYQPMSLRDLELRDYGLLDFFPTCRFSAADVGMLKPHSAIFEAALNCLGTLPQETVFVGDDPEADVMGAQGVGMKAVLRQSRRQPPHNGFCDPDAVIQRLDELPPLLDQWYAGWRA